MSTKSEKAAAAATAVAEAEKREAGKRLEKNKKWVERVALVVGGFLAANILAPVIVNHPLWSNLSSDIAVASSWPALESCDPITAVAGTDKVNRPEANAGIPDRAAVAGQPGGGAWSQGNATITIIATGDRQVVVRGMKPRIEIVEDRPTWVYAPEGGCGDVAFGELELDLDAGTLTSASAGEVESDASASILDVAGGFPIDAGTSAQILVTAQACERSYDFWLDIAYVRPGSADISHKELGPFRVYSGVAVQVDPAVTWLGDSGERARDTPVCSVPTFQLMD